MTDQQKFLDLMGSFGIEVTTQPSELHGPEDVECVLMAKQGGVDGYYGFFCVFRFGPAGEFRDVGVWE